MRRVIAIALCGLATAAAGAHAADETRMGGMDALNTRAVPDSPLRPPLKLRWQVDVGAPAGHVMVDDGRVLAIASLAGQGSRLVALSVADGRLLWSYPIPFVSGSTITAATEAGRVLLAVADPEPGLEVVRMRSIEAATGTVQWTRDFAAPQGLGGSRLVVDRGVAFFFTNDGGNDLHAVRITDGQELWKTELSSGSGSPAVDAERVYYSIGGGNGALDRDTGAHVWRYTEPGTSGGGGIDVLVHGGRMYGDWGRVHDTASGAMADTWNRCCFMAYANGVAVQYWDRGVRAFGPSWSTTRWENPNYPPSLIVGDHVYGSPGADSAYVVHALRLSDGAPAWCMRMSAPPTRESDKRLDSAYPSAAGEGTLIVRVGDTLAALEGGGTGSQGCEALPTGAFVAAPQPSGFPPAQTGRAIAIQVGRRDLLVGSRTNLTGRVSGVATGAGARVAIDIDEFPFDDRWTPSGRGRVKPDGTFAFKYAPRRNARLRARLLDGDLISPPVEVFADFPSVTRVFGRRSARPRIRWTIFGPRSAPFRTRRIHAYLLGGRPLVWRRVDSRRWQRRRGDRVSVDMRFPRGRLGRRDKWLVCYREAADDGFGRRYPVDPFCGDRVIRRELFP
jgi:hypothetical protein